MVSWFKSKASSKSTTTSERASDQFDSPPASATRFLSIPYEAHIQLAEQFGDLAADDHGDLVGDVRDRLNQIPPLPQTVNLILNALGDEGSSASTVANIISKDPGLASALLRAVNSTAYGLSTKVHSVDQAITLLGFSSVRSLVVRLKLAEGLAAPIEPGAYHHDDLWVHALAVSSLADHLARRVPGVDRGFASTLGLLHDLGKIAINSRMPAIARQLWEGTGHSLESTLLQRERELFGVDHAGVGMYLAQQWKLPSTLVDAIGLHHRPNDPRIEAMPPEIRKAFQVVYAANQLAKYCHAYGRHTIICGVPDTLFKTLDLTPPLAGLLDKPACLSVSRCIFFAESLAMQSAKKLELSGLAFHWGPEALENAKRFTQDTEEDATVQIGGALWKLSHHGGQSGGETLETHTVEQIQNLPERKLAYLRAARIESALDNDSLKALYAILIKHQESLGLGGAHALAARFVLRRLLDRLSQARQEGESVQVTQAMTQGRFMLAIESPALSFERRLGDGADEALGRALIRADTATVRNLGWYTQVDTSPTGDRLVLMTAPID